MMNEYEKIYGHGFEVVSSGRGGVYCCFWHTPVPDKCAILPFSSRAASELLISISQNNPQSIIRTLVKIAPAYIDADREYRLIKNVRRLPQHSVLLRSVGDHPHIVIYGNPNNSTGTFQIFSAGQEKLKKSYVYWSREMLADMKDAESFIRQNQYGGYLIGYSLKHDAIFVADEKSTLLIPYVLWEGLKRVLSFAVG